MKLHLAGDDPVIFWLESAYAERETAKRAGFWWHGTSCRPGCAACAAALGKVWWTPRAETARSLVEFADSYAREVLLGPDAKPPPKAPKKSGGHTRLTDANLRLAVLEELVARNLVIRPTTARGKDGVYDERIRDKLVSAAFPADALSKIDSLSWTTDAEAIYQIFPQWDGEEDEFEIRSLAGIGVCDGLRVIAITMFAGTDLAPLRDLAKLESLSLERPYSSRAIEDLSPLLDLPSLRSAEIHGVRRRAENDAVIEALRARGVRVKIGHVK